MVTTTLSCPTCKRAVDASSNRCVYDGTDLNCINTDPSLRTKYNVLSVLGSGGMGIIYKAQNLEKNQIVAIKTMHLHVMNPLTVQRFEREGISTAKLAHPSIASIFDFGVSASGQPYLVMDYVAGKTLGEFLQQNVTLDELQFFDIFPKVCQAMAHAHNRGVLHRDLKPSNIMLTPRQDGRFDVSILDFGIAKFTDESDFEVSKMTKTGDVIGSPAYMSPEQARGTKLDRRSDIYSLGCVMYEACTGVPPFFAKTALETVLMHFNDAPPAMSEASMGKQIDPNLQQFVCRLLEKNPDDRYQTMEAVEHDLKRIRAGKTLIISAPSSAKVKRGPVKKWLAVFAALAVLLLAGVALILWQFTHPSKIAPKAVTLKTDFDLHKFDEVMANSAARRIKRCIDQKNSVVDMTSLDKTSDVLNEDIDPLKGAGFVREVLINTGDIDDHGLKVLADLPITKLRLRNCQLKSLQPLAHHLQLSDLDLQGNPLDSEGIKNIGTIENLDSLNLTSTPIRDADLKSLLPLKHLQSLEIANCPGIHESAIREFEKEAHLTVRTRPSDPDLQYGIAERLRVKGKYAEAATQFERCSELVKAQETPDKEYLSNVIKKIGDCLMRSGRFEEALKSYEEAGKIYTASKPEPAETAAELTALASNYERWCLADPRNQNSLKKAIADRKQADKALALAGAKEADNRLLNLLAIISDAIAAGDIDLLSTEYAQLDVFEISKSLQLQMKDAVSAELRHNTASLKKAIALRQAAEPLFERFSQSRAHLELSLQNEVYLAADLFAVGDGNAGTDAIEKALKHNLQNAPLLAPTASVFEEAGDYWLKNGNANLANGFYVKAREQFTQALQIKDSARIEKKLSALNKA